MMGPRDFSRLLKARYGVTMSHQAISKAEYLPKTEHGRVIVADALVVLEQRGRLQTEQLPLVEPSEPVITDEDLTGRPRAKGSSYYDELTLTEKVKRRKLELEVTEKEGKLLPIEQVDEAMTTAGRRIGERIERLTYLADELNSAAHTGGTAAVREVLRRETRALRGQVAEAMTLAATDEEAAADGPA